MTQTQIKDVNLEQNKTVEQDLPNKRLSIVIVLHLCILLCKNMLVSTNAFFLSINSTLNNLILVAFVVIYAWAVLKARFLQRINLKAYVVVMLLAVFIGISCILDPQLFVSKIFPYDYVRSQARTFIAYCFPLFLAFSALRSTDYLLKLLFKATPVLFGFATLSFGLSAVSQTTSNDYSMAYGHALMFVAILLLFKYQSNHKVLTIIAFVLTTFYILVSGSRGPLVAIAVAVLAVLFTGKMSTGKLVWIFVVVVGAIVFLVGYSFFLGLIQNLLDSLGMSSRTLSMMIQGNIAYDSGRSEFHQDLIEAINESPILGLGAFGGEVAVGLAHNLYLDIMANFGYIFGSIFIIAVLYNTFKVIHREKNTSLSTLTLMFAIIVFARGFFNGEFWAEKELWIILGVIINYDKIGDIKAIS